MKITSRRLRPVLSILFFILFYFWITNIVKSKDSNSKKNELKTYQHSISGNAYITDGDTIKLGKERIRLIEIDAPEMAQKCYDKNNNSYLCGVMSKNFLLDLVKSKEVFCKYNKRDIYSRILGNCYVGNESINEKMVANGMAVVFSYSKFDEILKKLQEEAKSKKVGIWQGSFELPKNYRKRMRK